MRKANYIRPVNGYILAKYEDTRENSIMLRVVSIAKDEEEIQVGDLIEALSKSYDHLDVPVLSNVFRLKKSDIIGVYCLVSDDKKMFEEFDE